MTDYSTLLRDHVTLTCRSIDRIFLQAYVPKLLAMRRLVSDPETYDISISPIPNQPYFARVDTRGQIELKVAAEIAGVTVHKHGGPTDTELTVLLNGILVQNNSVLKGGTTYIGAPSYRPHGDMPLRLQDHGHLVRFRNIWLRKL
jgi:hypothetical protein